MASLLGAVPTLDHMMRIDFEELKVVLLQISEQSESTEQDLRPVPQDKLNANGLSSSVQTLLKVGMARAKKVEDFLDHWHDPRLGDHVAEAFHRKYEELKRQLSVPDEIFWALQIYAGGSEIPLPKHQAAVLAVLAYLFERCHIFERTREDTAT
ncbi:MAG: ABC-three component system protein [Bacilli bacterium]